MIESEDSQECAKETGFSTIENREPWMVDFKQVCDEVALISGEEGVNSLFIRAMEEIKKKNENNIEEIQDNEENDSFEDIKKWAVNQKQSITSD